MSVAIAFIALGVSLLANPLAGVVSLTILTAVMLLVAGLAKVFMARAFQENHAFWAVIISGMLSIALALLILFGMPEMLAITLGVFFAVDLISSGAAMIVIGMQISAK